MWNLSRSFTFKRNIGMYILYLVLTSACLSEGAVLDWLYYPFQRFSGKTIQTSLYPRINEVLLDSIQFEAGSEYDKFLIEAQRMMNIQLSGVEICQHKVIMKIKSSCTTLTEDDLAKMSVNLLNCKSAQEEKKQFVCTSKMALEDCTRNMDAEMWNAYRVMNDKARSLCFSVRQQLFKAMTEMVVNKLIHSSQDQLQSMKILQDGQKVMLEQQDTLREAQDSVSVSLASHMRFLQKEKALMIAAHGEIAKIVQGMHQKMDEASSQMDALLAERKANHNKLVKNISTLQAQVIVLLQQIDRSIQLVKDQNEEITSKYKDAIEGLSHINSTVQYLLQILEMTQNELDARMKWMSSFLGGTGDHMAVMFAFTSHLGYLLLGMIAMAFVGAPVASRLLLITIVPINLLLVINPARIAFPFPLGSLDFHTMTVVIVLFTLGSFIVTYAWRTTNLWATRSPESSWNSSKGTKFVDISAGERVHLSGVDVPFGDYCFRKLSSALNALGSLLDPRVWWASGEVDSTKENWSRGLMNGGLFSSPSTRACKPDIDDSSDTDGPLLVEKDDDDDYDTEVYSGQVFCTNFLQKNYPQNENTASNRPLSTLLQEKSRSSSTTKSLCVAICQNGHPCRNSCINGHILCHRHSQQKLMAY